MRKVWHLSVAAWEEQWTVAAVAVKPAKTSLEVGDRYLEGDVELQPQKRYLFSSILKIEARLCGACDRLGVMRLPCSE